MTNNRLHRYRILERLGKGGSGEVFLGIDPFKRSVAVKIQRRPRKRLRFMQEYKILNEFPHPSLVSVYEYGLLSGGWSYLVLELINGKSATGYVRSLYGSDRLYKCIQIAIKISEAFGSLHQMNWIHGDIKSNNILVDQSGIPHLIDFELARALSSTGTGKFFGTRSYAPPEQHDGLKLDASVDVYAMAGVLHRMITNKSVFERVDNAKEAHHRRTTAPNISKSIPKNLRTLLQNALDPDAQKRPANGYQFADQLRVCLPIPEDTYPDSTSNSHMAHLCEILDQNELAPELFALHLWSLTGGDSVLINRFAYSYAQEKKWIPSDYHEQVWHYLQHLPEATQRAFYVLACLGGKASTSLLHKFAGVSRRQLTKQLEKLPHWVRKDGVLWHLYVGATHAACLHLLPHEQGLVELFEFQKSLPKWAKLCVEALHHPENILQEATHWINTKANTLHQWRLLSRIEGHELQVDSLKERLLFRRNGDWLQSLQLQSDGPAQRLLSIFERVHPSDIPTLDSMTRSTNIDIWVVSRALLAEWYILHGQFTKGESYIVPLCSHEDPYPRIIGLQQRALLYHHLNQQSRLSTTHRALEEISCQPITNKIRRLIANKEWTTNLLTEEEVPSTYLHVRKSLELGEPVGESLRKLVTELPVLEQSFLAVHPLWSGRLSELALPIEPKQEEFTYTIDPGEDFSCSQ
jgi:serine/threonine protein kinase